MFKQKISSRLLIVITFVLFSGFHFASYAQAVSEVEISVEDNLIEIPLLTVASEALKSEAKISLLVNASNQIVKAKLGYSDGDSRMIELDQLKSGAILYENHGYKIIELKAQDLNVNTGGGVNMEYLFDATGNYFKGSYMIYKMNLVRSRSGWEVEVDDAQGRRVIHTLEMKTKKKFGKVVGIKEIIAT